MTEGPGKCRARAAVTQQDKDAAKRDAQVKVWRAWRRERREALLAGPYSADAQALLDFLQTMRISSATELIKVVNCGPWCQTDSDTRFEVLILVDDAIIALRERNGLPAIDDPLPGQPDNVFRRIKHMLFAALPRSESRFESDETGK